MEGLDVILHLLQPIPMTLLNTLDPTTLITLDVHPVVQLRQLEEVHALLQEVQEFYAGVLFANVYLPHFGTLKQYRINQVPHNM